MGLRENSGTRIAWALAVLCALAIGAFAPGARSLAGINRGDHPYAKLVANAPLPGGGNSATLFHPRVRNGFLDFLRGESAYIAQALITLSSAVCAVTHYLRLASGAEQSLVVAAPLGGLQIEMHDMTGDHVQNDVVLRPALLRWPPTVLVNDGHNHFAVLVSGANPSGVSSRENLDPFRRDGAAVVFFRFSGFKTVQVPHSRGFLVPQLEQSLISPFGQSSPGGHRTCMHLHGPHNQSRQFR